MPNEDERAVPTILLIAHQNTGLCMLPPAEVNGDLPVAPKPMS
jgi:hypothetical protein